MILAIDTSTDQASVALLRAGIPCGEWSWTTRGNHSRHLTRVIRELLLLAGSSISSLEALVVARGPGSFNGIRVGVSEAKGIALALQVPLVGISTLDVIGFQSSRTARDVWAIVSAGRDQVRLGHYQGDGGGWERIGEYRTTSIAEAALLVGGADLLAGCGAEMVARELSRRGLEMRVEPAVWRMRRASFLAELGRRYLEAGGSDQLETLEPLYLRRSAAEEKRESNLQE